MKVRVSDRGIPTNQNVASEAQLEFAEENRIREIAIVADLDFSVFADGEMHAVHRAIAADHKGIGLAAQKALEGIIGSDARLRTGADIRRQRAVSPSFDAMRFVTHVTPVRCGCEPPNCSA